MSDEIVIVGTDAPDVTEEPHVQLMQYLSNPGYQKYGRFLFAVLGSIPWIGSVLGAAAALHAEEEQGRVNLLIYRWLEEHEVAKKRLEETIGRMVSRMEEIGEAVSERIQDERYLGLVRQGFRVWDESHSEEKREYVRRTLTNASGTKLCSDDVVRLFLQWIQQYNELHFRVIRIVYKDPMCTRADIWAELHGEVVPENSAEADLFKMIIDELSIGRVMRQHRETTSDNKFLRSRPVRKKIRSPVLTSAFEGDKPYELTELGSQFVHYAMDEVAPRLGAPNRSRDAPA